MNNLTCEGYCSELDFYQEYFELRPSLVLFLLYSVLTIPITISLLSYIIWFEHNGPDSRRNLINRLVSPICAVSIFYIVFPQSIDFLRYFFGPYPHLLCYFNLFMKNILVVMSLFFFTFITLSQYVSIFILRNPLGYYDDFWSRFICMWVTLGTVLIQSALDFLPGKHPVNYYVCTGKNPALDTNKETKTIRNYSIMVGCLVVIIVYIFVQIKIKLYEKNLVTATVGVQDKKPLTDYLIVVSYIIYAIVHVILLFKIQELDNTKMGVFPNYLYLYYNQFGSIPNFSIMLTSLYFARNHQLRKTLVREIREVVANVWNGQL
jgi:hypothetical protein